MISRLGPAMGARTMDQEPSDASGAVAITTGICIAACGGDMEFNRTPMTAASASASCWLRIVGNNLTSVVAEPPLLSG